MKPRPSRGLLLLLAPMLLRGAAASSPGDADSLVANQKLGLRHPPGFQITRFATREEAPDVISLTFDSQGRPVASGRGWIKRFADTDADGKADKVTPVAETTTGARGMVFLGNDLYCLADGSLGRFLDSDGDGVADGPPQRFFNFAFGPEGVQALRRGPDGAWYVMAGGQANLGPTHWNFPGSPIRNPEGGALLHISPDLSRSEVVADGFLHAHDFDFHPSGMLFTYDHGDFRDLFLPWMTFPRLFQIAHGAHHGWTGTDRISPRSLPDYDPAQVPVLWSANAASPAGLVFYRHHQFPTDYRGGLFAADWQNGRILFFKTQPYQSGFTVAAHPFIEAMGHNGFTPTALAVGSDGSLYIATGGRGTGSGIYKVRYTQLDPKTGTLPDQPMPFLSNLDAVLRAPQRLEAWSRANWVPLASREGRHSFEQVAMSVGDPEEYKLVSIDVMTELFGGLTRWEANVTAKSAFPSVRARTAWSIARYPFEGSLPVLQELLRDESALVRRAALEVYTDSAGSIPPLELLRVVTANLDQDDPRTREEALALAVKLPAEQWQELVKLGPKQSPVFRLMTARARLLRTPPQTAPDEASLREALAVLRQPEKGTPQLGLLALRVVADSFGGPNLRAPAAEAFAGFELKIRPAEHADLAAGVLQAARPLFPVGNPIVDAELARTLAYFEDHDPATAQRMLGAFGMQSPVASDIHYLACMACLNPAQPVPALTNLAEVLLWLDNKTGEPGAVPGLHWRTRVTEITSRLLTRHPALGTALVANGKFADGSHAWLLPAFDAVLRDRARQILLAASARPTGFVWNDDVIQLLADAPSEALWSRLRAQWVRPDLRDAIVQALARKPEPEDRERFAGALASVDPATTAAALTALTALDDPSPATTVPAVIKVLHQAVTQPRQAAVRRAGLAWLRKHGGWTGALEEAPGEQRDLAQLYQPVFQWFADNHPAAAAAQAGMTGDEFKFWETQLAEAPWLRGRAETGRELFTEHHCAECHAGGAGFGPSLPGLAALLSPEELMRRVVYPNRDIAPGAGVADLDLRNGEHLSGVIVSESPENILLRQESGETMRIARTEIARRRLTNDSLMPVGLLKGLNARGLADLYAYLASLK